MVRYTTRMGTLYIEKDEIMADNDGEIPAVVQIKVTPVVN